MLDENREKELKLREVLSVASIYDLRVIGRREGVYDSTTLKKEALIQGIVDVLLGTVKPNLRKKAGAPAKNNSVDPKLDEALREILCSRDEDVPMNYMENHAEGNDDGFVVFRESDIRSGILEILPSGYGFVRSQRFLVPDASEDVYVSAPQIRALHLREGDYIACKVLREDKNGSAALKQLISVNEMPLGFYEKRHSFETMSVRYPDRKLCMTYASSDLTLRALDLLVPVGRGQRALITGPRNAGKTSLIKKIASALSCYESITAFVLLVDARPEEISDVVRNAGRANVLATSYEDTAAHHIRTARLVLERAKRLCESGRHAVILLDSADKLAEAFEKAAETLPASEKKAASSLAPELQLKRYFGTARNTTEGGSVTIIASVSSDADGPSYVYDELKSLCNCEIFLKKDLSPAPKKIFPAVDFERSCTQNGDALLDSEEADALFEIKKRCAGKIPAAFFDELARTEDNDMFIALLPKILPRLS